MMKGRNVREVENGLGGLYLYGEKGGKNKGMEGVYGRKTGTGVKGLQ